MTSDEARDAVRVAISRVAPDVDADELDDGARLRQDLELDSLDFLRLIEEIAGSTGVDTPESDYPLVQTVGGLVGYVTERG